LTLNTKVLRTVGSYLPVHMV